MIVIHARNNNFEEFRLEASHIIIDTLFSLSTNLPHRGKKTVGPVLFLLSRTVERLDLFYLCCSDLIYFRTAVPVVR